MVLCSGEVDRPVAGRKSRESVCRFDKKRILVPTDFSEGSRQALECALGLARAFGCNVVLLNVEDRRTLASASQFDELQEEVMRAIKEEFDSFIAGLPAQDVEVERVIGASVGDPTHEIVRRAREVDLVVIPAPSGSRLGQTLLDSVVERVIRRAPCPVLCVRPAVAQQG